MVGMNKVKKVLLSDLHFKWHDMTIKGVIEELQDVQKKREYQQYHFENAWNTLCLVGIRYETEEDEKNRRLEEIESALSQKYLERKEQAQIMADITVLEAELEKLKNGN